MPFVDRVLAQQWLGEELDIDEFFGAIEKTTNSEQLHALGQGLSALAGKLNAAQARAGVAKFLEMIAKTTDPDQFNALGQGLSALAGKLDAAQAQAVMAKFLEMIAKTTSLYQLHALGQGLSALAGKLDAAQAQAGVAKYVEMIAKTTDSDELRALGQGLSALAGKLDAEQKAYALDAIGASMLRARNGFQGSFLAQSASAFLEGVPLSGQRARYWIEACRHPFVDRSQVARAIRLGNPGAPSEEQGLWALLRWAVAKYKIDSRASLKPPVADNR
jgi:ribosomal protein S7